MAKNFRSASVQKAEQGTTTRRKFNQMHEHALDVDTERKLSKGMEEVANSQSLDEELPEGIRASRLNYPDGAIPADGNAIGGELLSGRNQPEPTKGVQIRMPESVYKRMLMYKYVSGMTLQNIIITATREWLDANEKK